MKYEDEEWLKKNFIEKDKTIKEIAEELEVSMSAISYRLRKFNIKKNYFGDKITKECMECSEEITRAESQFEDTWFCSTDCSSKYKENKVGVVCENCGTSFEKIKSQLHDKNYCSKECRFEYQRGKNHPNYNTKELKCTNCSGSFERQESLIGKTDNNFCCEECYKEYVATDRDKNKHQHKRWRKDVRNRDEWTCQSCGYEGDRIEAHHIESWQDNPGKRFDLDNGKSLCIECHYITHKNRGDDFAASMIESRTDEERLEKLMA